MPRLNEFLNELNCLLTACFLAISMGAGNSDAAELSTATKTVNSDTNMNTTTTSEAQSATKRGVSALLQMQADAWNKGDLDKFMTGYVHSPQTSYTSGGVEVWGYDALRERYLKKYGDKRDTMGKLAFSDLRIIELGSTNALCIGHWHLERAGQPDLDGVFSLVLTDTNQGWKVLHDHTSVIDKKS